MFAPFSISLTALQADSSAINVVGNNLANLNTTGFKSENVQFEDLMAQSLGSSSSPAQVGMGVGPIGTSAQYTQGTLTVTNGPADAAIQGNGFFVVKDANNQALYTRDGSFQVDTNGNLTTATGEMVQGWTAVNGVVNPNGAVGNITVPAGAVSPATPTTTMSIQMNLNAGAAAGAASSFAVPVQAVDSQGATHTLTASFQKTGPNAWSYTVSIPAADLTTGGSTTVSTGTLAFDATGNLAATNTAPAVSVTGLLDGASDMSMTWNLFDGSGNSKITQFAQASALGNVSQDGVTAGQIANVSLQNGGLVVANYSNGKQAVIGQLAVASIGNPQTLLAVGNNNLATSAATAAPALGAAGTAGRGAIVAGSLESSTVDMAAQFTDLLSYERSYQAASRVITASDQLLQETVNLIHP
jgi:flagellar hook protein FlgE